MTFFQPLQFSIPDGQPVPYFYDGLVSPRGELQFPYTANRRGTVSPLGQDASAYQLPPSMAASENFFENAIGTPNFSLDGDTSSSGQPLHATPRNTPRTISYEQPQLDHNSNLLTPSAQPHIPKSHLGQEKLNRSDSLSWDQTFHGTGLTSVKSRQDSLSSQGSAKVQKRGRKPSTRRDSEYSAPHQIDDLDGDGLPKDPRRRRILERNRIAATKCRLRKRDEASALASREQAMEDQNRYLSTCFDSLTAEIYHLKTQLLRHTDCNCVLIQKYIANEAQRSVDNMVGGSTAPTKQNTSLSPAFSAPSVGSSCDPLGMPSPAAEAFPIQWTNPFQSMSSVPGHGEALLDLGLVPFQKAPLLPDSLSAASSTPVTPTSMPGGDTYFPTMNMPQPMVDHNGW